MKKNLIFLLGALSLSACAVNEKISKSISEQTPPQLMVDTIYLTIPEKTDPSDTIVGYNAYLKSKELNGKATKEFYSGNEEKADSLYRLSLRMLSQSNLSSQDFNFLDLNDQFRRLTAYRELKEKERNGIIITEKDIKNVLKEEKSPIGQKFAERVAYEKKKLETVNKKWFLQSLKRMQPYQHYIDSLLKEKDLNSLIKWMYPVESGMKTNIRSRANAVGLAQFMSWTAKSYGLKVYGRWCDERLDPIKSLDASINYMQLLNEWFNNPSLAIAAYNAGQGRINSLVNEMKISSYQKLSKENVLPIETENHLPKIYAFRELAKETKIEGDKPNKILEDLLKNNFDTISIKRQTDLDVISKTLGISTKLLREYNPAYQMFSTPPRQMVKGKYLFVFRIPKNIKDGFYKKLSNENPLPKPRVIYYRVRSWIEV